MSAAEIRQLIKAKRIAAFDFGMKRIGWAVCDELHISNTPKGVFERAATDFWDVLLSALVHERIGVCIVGVPYRLDGAQSAIHEEIRKFIAELELRSGLVVLETDESFTSKRAVETMIEIGVSKKSRREKSRTDEISAAIILRDFINEFE